MNTFIFVALPYLVLALLFLVTIYRYLTNRLTWSAYSTELLERRLLYWGSNPWHYGIIPLLLFHLVPFLFPGLAAGFLGNQQTLLVLESLGLGLALLALLGILILTLRRVNTAMLKRSTYFSDWLILFLLLVQVGSGVYIAVALRWGSLWYLHAAVPYFWSIWSANPQPEYLADLPAVVKVHAACAFLILGVLPFTKLVHLLYLPIDFLKDQPILYRWRGRE
ncbi:respiratory nitrate reductase subunit gamma [Geomonas sp. Red32]|uniref:respiratory nitrate reductase subunit gamma n=1 Tax=Geomonas sp. Red32 TaxID=2912856 RepID=UPI00202CF081|nr:respiratory nitrate reductase subunit gamma [Geomonas sp. Red32]MCM0080689.1 respiratory nitrate reductase subunit gamma [Geomonas sp. Red32]